MANARCDVAVLHWHQRPPLGINPSIAEHLLEIVLPIQHAARPRSYSKGSCFIWGLEPDEDAARTAGRAADVMNGCEPVRRLFNPRQISFKPAQISLEASSDGPAGMSALVQSEQVILGRVLVDVATPTVLSKR